MGSRDLEVHTAGTVITWEAIIRGGVVIVWRRLSIEFMTLREIQHVEQVQPSVRAVVLSASNTIGCVYSPLS